MSSQLLPTSLQTDLFVSCLLSLVLQCWDSGLGALSMPGSHPTTKLHFQPQHEALLTPLLWLQQPIHPHFPQSSTSISQSCLFWGEVRQKNSTLVSFLSLGKWFPKEDVVVSTFPATQKAEDHMFKASLGDLVRPCLKTKLKGRCTVVEHLWSPGFTVLNSKTKESQNIRTLWQTFGE